MSSEPTAAYTSGRSFNHVVFGGQSLGEWLDHIERWLARNADRPVCAVNRCTLQADLIASAVLAMQNVDDLDGNEGELARQVHDALRKTYERWMEQPPPLPYFKSRMLERDPSVGRAYCCAFEQLGVEQRKTITSIVAAFLAAYEEVKMADRAPGLG